MYSEIDFVRQWRFPPILRQLYREIGFRYWLNFFTFRTTLSVSNHVNRLIFLQNYDQFSKKLVVQVIKFVRMPSYFNSWQFEVFVKPHLYYSRSAGSGRTGPASSCCYTTQPGPGESIHTLPVRHQNSNFNTVELFSYILQLMYLMISKYMMLFVCLFKNNSKIF